MSEVSTGSIALVFYPEYPFIIKEEGKTRLAEDLRSAAELFKNDPDYIHSYMVCKISLWGHSIVPYSQEIIFHGRAEPNQLAHFQEVIAEMSSWMTIVEEIELPPITYYTSDLQPIINQNILLTKRKNATLSGLRNEVIEETYPESLRPTVSQVFTTHNYTTAYKTWDTRFNFCFQESSDCSVININR